MPDKITSTILGATPQLKSGWCIHTGPAANLDTAGIYQWSIEGVGVYVGKAKVLRTRLPAYARNVRAMLAGKPWHGNAAKEYRAIHHALREAHDAGTPVTVAVLETCEPADCGARERHWIKVRRDEAARGGPRVLNSI